jgi:hypothetical protein
MVKPAENLIIGDKTRITVTNMTEADFTPTDFLFLCPPESQIAVQNGDLLLGPQHTGRIFVKGLFLQYNQDLQVGINLTKAVTNRDR